MFKKIGVLTMVLAGALLTAPVQATAAEWHNGGERGNFREHREPIRQFDGGRFYGGRERGFQVYREPRREFRGGYYNYNYAPPAYGYYGNGYGYGYNAAPYAYGPRCR